MQHPSEISGTDSAHHTARDPVCGMQVDPDKAGPRFVHGSSTYYFCCEGCAAKFRTDPEKYLAGTVKSKPQDDADDALFTCPMHPAVRQAGPGSCPICGMALEPEVP